MPEELEPQFRNDSFLFDDLIQPFNLKAGRQEGPALSGRFTKLGNLTNEVIGKHKYPGPVSKLVSESLALGATLAGALKFDGVFTFQIQGDGPVSLVVVDISTKDEGNSFQLRSYAQYQSEGIVNPDLNSARDLLGKGYMALTVDQGSNTERYKGLVELVGDSLDEFTQHYFKQSQQMDAAIMLCSGMDKVSGGWRASCIMLQRVAEENHEKLSSNDTDDPWRRNMILMATGTTNEMLDPDLSPKRYLYRLFHEEGLRVMSPRLLRSGCRCNKDRLVRMLRQLPKDELLELSDNGMIEVTCEFCSEVYLYNPISLEVS